MSDEQDLLTATTDAGEQQQAQLNDSEPSPERQGELKAAYEANVAAGKAPYAGVVIQTRGELNWIVREREWQNSHIDTLDQTIDLRYVGFASANFSGANFVFANLSSAVIAGDDTNFSGADFTNANLSGAHFVGDDTNFSGANFTLADLTSAFIGEDRSNFSGANFTLADLTKAFIGGDRSNFSGVNFTNANLSGAQMAGDRSDFSGADFTNANLSGAHFVNSDSNFSGAKFIGANLSGAQITGDGSDFSSAYFGNANLSGVLIAGDRSDFSIADFSNANLSGAHITGDGSDFSGAKFIGANLSGAVVDGSDINFSGADFTGINLSGAVLLGYLIGVNLTQARMDAATILGESTDPEGFRLDATTRLLDVAWNGAILVNIAWTQVPRVGDEADIKAATSRKERVQALGNAARTYRGLTKALQAQGLTIPALTYHAREQQLERRALLYSFALGPWLFSWLLNIVSGYGDKPGRALACYVAVVGTFMAAYWAITNQVFGFIQSQSTHLAWYEALVLSISSFHGRGFFPSMLSLGDPIALVAAAEAIIGLFIELVFIATFTQRFFAR